jgi:hypothetical protein
VATGTSSVVSAIGMRLSSLARCISHHNGGYAESTVSERRLPICGYLASSLSRLRRARVGEQFGKVVGYCALRDQYRILWAIRMSRTSGLARMFFRLPPQKLPFCASRARTREPVFAANMEISCVRLNQKPAGDAKICLYEMASKVPGFCPEWFFKVPHSSLEKERAESFGRVWKVVEPHCLDGVGHLVRL